MQQDIQEIFARIEEKKAERKELKQACKELLDASQEYQEVQEELKALREKRKRIQNVVQEQCATELIKIDELSTDIASDEELLTDMTISKYTKGESIELTDKYANNYEPVFVVKFRKVK